MYLYFDKSGKISTVIPHGDPARQGSLLRLYVCFDYDFFTDKGLNRENIEVNVKLKMPGQDMGVANSPIIEPTLTRFEKNIFSEVTYNLIPGKRYWIYKFEIDSKDSTNYPGKLAISTSLLEKTSSSELYEASTEIFVEKTFGKTQAVALDTIELEDIKKQILEPYGVRIANVEGTRRFFRGPYLPSDKHDENDIFLLTGVYKTVSGRVKLGDLAGYDVFYCEDTTIIELPLVPLETITLTANKFYYKNPRYGEYDVDLLDFAFELTNFGDNLPETATTLEKFTSTIGNIYRAVSTEDNLSWEVLVYGKEWIDKLEDRIEKNEQDIADIFSGAKSVGKAKDFDTTTGTIKENFEKIYNGTNPVGKSKDYVKEDGNGIHDAIEGIKKSFNDFKDGVVEIGSITVDRARNYDTENGTIKEKFDSIEYGATVVGEARNYNTTRGTIKEKFESIATGEEKVGHAIKSDTATNYDLQNGNIKEKFQTVDSEITRIDNKLLVQDVKLGTKLDRNFTTLTSVEEVAEDYVLAVNNANGEARQVKFSAFKSSVYQDHFKGDYPSYEALVKAHPTAEAGDYAYVDIEEEGKQDLILYIWDDDEGQKVWRKSDSTQFTKSDTFKAFEKGILEGTTPVGVASEAVSYTTGGPIGQKFSLLMNQTLELSDEIEDENLPVLRQLKIANEAWQIKPLKMTLSAGKDGANVDGNSILLAEQLKENTNYMCIMETSLLGGEYTFTINTGTNFKGISTSSLLIYANGALMVQVYMNDADNKMYFNAYQLKELSDIGATFVTTLLRFDIYELPY